MAAISTAALAVALAAGAAFWATTADAAHSKSNTVDCPKPEGGSDFAAGGDSVQVDDGTCELVPLASAELDAKSQQDPPGGDDPGGGPGGGDPGGGPGGGDPGGDPGGGDPGGDPGGGGGGNGSSTSGTSGDHVNTGENAADAGSGAIGAGQGAIGAGLGAIGAGSGAMGAGQGSGHGHGTGKP